MHIVSFPDHLQEEDKKHIFSVTLLPLTCEGHDTTCDNSSVPATKNKLWTRMTKELLVPQKCIFSNSDQIIMRWSGSSDFAKVGETVNIASKYILQLSAING